LIGLIVNKSADGYNFTIEDLGLQEKLEVYKQQTEAFREKFLVQKAEFDADMQRLEAAKEEPDEKKGEDEEMTDVPLDDDPMSEWFQCPSTMTRWEDRWECRRRSTEARSRKRCSSV